MTVQELAKSIAHQQGEGWADPDVATAFEEWVNEGVEELVAAANWPSLSLTVPLSVVAGTAQYDLPVTMGGISAVFDPATGRKLHYRPRDEQAMLALDPDVPGESTHWAYGPTDEATGLRSVLLWPVPSADGQLSVFGERAATFTLAATYAIPVPPEFILSVLRTG